MNKKLWIGLGVILLIGAMVGTAILRNANAAIDVVVTQLKKEELNEVILVSGTLQPEKSFSVYPEVGHGSPQLEVKLGDKVKKGATLVKYDNPAFRVKSKQEGTVVFIGDSQQVGSQPLVIVADPAKQKVVAEVSEFDALKVKKGQKVTVRSDALPDKKWSGQVTQVGDYPQSTEGIGASSSQIMYPVEISLDKATSVKLGSRLIVEITTDSQFVNSLPEDAVVHRNGKDLVFVVEQGRVVEKEVKLGIRGKGKVEILSGVKANEEIVAKPPRDLEDGMEVKVK